VLSLDRLFAKRWAEYAVLTLGVALAVFHFAYRESRRGGFPVFSMRTWEAIWPWVVMLVVLLAIALGPSALRYSKGKSSNADDVLSNNPRRGP